MEFTFSKSLLFHNKGSSLLIGRVKESTLFDTRTRHKYLISTYTLSTCITDSVDNVIIR